MAVQTHVKDLYSEIAALAAVGVGEPVRTVVPDANMNLGRVQDSSILYVSICKQDVL